MKSVFTNTIDKLPTRLGKERWVVYTLGMISVVITRDVRAKTYYISWPNRTPQQHTLDFNNPSTYETTVELTIEVKPPKGTLIGTKKRKKYTIGYRTSVGYVDPSSTIDKDQLVEGSFRKKTWFDKIGPGTVYSRSINDESIGVDLATRPKQYLEEWFDRQAEFARDALERAEKTLKPKKEKLEELTFIKNNI